MIADFHHSQLAPARSRKTGLIAVLAGFLSALSLAFTAQASATPSQGLDPYGLPPLSARALIYGDPVLSLAVPDCADPTVTRDPTVRRPRYWMVCTGNQIPGITLYSSTNMLFWTQVSTALITRASAPHWAQGSLWGPSLQYMDGLWHLFFTARNRSGTLQIAVATAARPQGPYVPSRRPVLNQIEGAIDPQPYTFGNSGYLLWKVDGNSHGLPSMIQIARLNPAGTAIVSAPVTLIANSLPWEGQTIEGPFLIEHKHSFYLFFCANKYSNWRYAIGVGRSRSIMGPYQVHGTPILKSRNGWDGPGGPSVALDPENRESLFFAAFQGPLLGMHGPRDTFSAALLWSPEGWPWVPANEPLSDVPSAP